ncbi:hypothetical protein, partial [uncultured Selenomonas sp.]|uniref:hypothetical protein n=1 Tax=uncultured Selenomonas sp. TaxID=159275 RepID=UPI0025DEF387
FVSTHRVKDGKKHFVSYGKGSTVLILCRLNNSGFLRLEASAEEFLFSVFSVEIADMLFLTTIDMINSSLMCIKDFFERPSVTAVSPFSGRLPEQQDCMPAKLLCSSFHPLYRTFPQKLKWFLRF